MSAQYENCISRKKSVTPPFDRNQKFQIREMFEIKDDFANGHDIGLVIVLDQRLCEDPGGLAGRQATLHMPDGNRSTFEIAEAKDHLKATSLFFKNKCINDIPAESQVTIESY
jgi:hypothetical protein